MDVKAIIMGVAFSFMWSSAFSSARVIVAHAPPLTTLGVRFLLSGLIAIGIALVLGQSWRLTPAQWRATLLFGLCQNGLYLGLNFVAMRSIEASVAVIVASLLPLLVALAGWLFLQEWIGRMAILGLTAGFAGVALIMGSRIGGGIDLWGLLLCVLGVLSLAVATLAVTTAGSGDNVLMVVGLQMLVGCVPLGILGLLVEPLVIEWTWQLVVAFLYTLIFPGLTATFVWFLLVKRIGATRAATFHFLNPFLGVLVAALTLGEIIGLWDIVGVLVVMGGILMVQLARAQARRR